MKKINKLLILILTIPIAIAMYGGESKVLLELDNCKEVNVSVLGTSIIEKGEYFFDDCNETIDNIWNCECDNHFNLILNTGTSTVNNYTFNIDYITEEETNPTNIVTTSFIGGSGGGSSSHNPYCRTLKDSNGNIIKWYKYEWIDNKYKLVITAETNPCLETFKDVQDVKGNKTEGEVISDLDSNATIILEEEEEGSNWTILIIIIIVIIFGYVVYYIYIRK